MRLNFTRIVAILTAVLFLYSACKKTDNKPVATKIVNYDALSSQIALSLSRGISGGFGGANINDGIKAPANLTTNKATGLKLFDINPFCGYKVDTAFNTTSTVNDTIKTVKGMFQFTYNCSSANIDGYTVHDTITTIDQGSKFNNTYAVGQNYIVKALDNTYKNVSMDGNINVLVFARVLALGGATTEYHYMAATYTLNGVTVKITNGVADVVTGTAKFKIFKNDLDPTTAIDGTITDYTGTITFLGNNKAKLTIDGNPSKSYNVDLITGVVTPL